jgi:hypothetical protein
MTFPFWGLSMVFADLIGSVETLSPRPTRIHRAEIGDIHNDIERRYDLNHFYPTHPSLPDT